MEQKFTLYFAILLIQPGVASAVTCMMNKVESASKTLQKFSLNFLLKDGLEST